MEQTKRSGHESNLQLLWKKRDCKTLNELFEPLDIMSRIERLYGLFSHDEILFSSSFGTRSALMIHLIHLINPDQKIHFINTGFLFEETIEYKNFLSSSYNMEVLEIRPDPVQHSLTFEETWWNDHPRMCCTINKIAPLDSVIKDYTVWISGLMGFQNLWRSGLDIFEEKGDIMKFHPLIDISPEQFKSLVSQYKLPAHPLESRGYGSVGCTHCTVKGEERTGRWANTQQTECGLHQSFYYKKKE